MRVFLDTNVLAAGFATRGLCSDLIREVLENHEWVCSDAILTELQRILTKKFRVTYFRPPRRVTPLGLRSTTQGGDPGP